MRIDGEVDLADALDLEAAIAADAHHQLLAGSTESLDVRRSIAAGNLARTQQTLDLTETAEKTGGPTRRRMREVVLHVHLEEAAVLGAGGLARLHEARGPVTAEQVRAWCANPDTAVTVQPVLDLAEHLHVGSYEASARLKLQTQLRDLICAFAFCFRPAEDCDCEHRVPADPDRATPDPPAPATSPPAAGATTAPKPPAAGPTSPSNPASTCGAARWATSSSKTTPAPSTSPPTKNDSASPTSSAPTSATPPSPAPPTPNPDHPAPPPLSATRAGMKAPLSADHPQRQLIERVRVTASDAGGSPTRADRLLS